MHNLVPYDGDAFNLYKDAVKRKTNSEIKRRLEDAEDTVARYYSEYESEYGKDNLRGLSPNRVKGSLYKDLYDMYEFDSAVVKVVRNRLKDLNPPSVIGICQHCGIAPYDTIDHILSHKQYVEYSIHAKNLIPCCTDCNRRKNEQPLLNLYIDTLPKVEYLFMDVADNGDTLDLRFRLDNSGGAVEASLFAKIEDHFEKLDLLKRYKNMAIARLSYFVIVITERYRSGGRNAVIESVAQGFPDMRQAYGYNYWEVVFQKGLIESDVFWDYFEKNLLA